MPHPRTARLIRPFRRAASAYCAEPAIMSGLELHEIVGQLKQAAASELLDPDLVALLHRCLQALRVGNSHEVRSLLAHIGTRLDGLEDPSEGGASLEG